MKILWLTNIPSPYRVDFFNELGKQCELTVLFERAFSTERDKSWSDFKSDNFKAVLLKGKPIGVAEAFCPSVLKYLKKNVYDRIVVTNYSSPTGILACYVMKLKGIHYCIEGDGAFPHKNSGIKHLIKKSIFTGSDICFSTAELHDEYYRNYGVTDDKIVRYPFTSIHKKDILDKPVSIDEKTFLRKNLGMTEDKIVLSVGQFIHRKGFDILLEASRELTDNVGIYIVGGEPTEEYIDYVRQYHLDRVHFVGFKTKNLLSEFYKAADLFVLPTREDIWGLVINEALSFGLPVVTTDKCIAGCQMLSNASCGIIVPVENSKSLLKAIYKLLDNNLDINQQALYIAEKYSIEVMVKRHLEIFSRG